MRIEDRILTPLTSQDEGGEEAPEEKKEGAGEEGEAPAEGEEKKEEEL